MNKPTKTSWKMYYDKEEGSSSYKVRIGGGGIVGVGQRACNRSEGEWLRGDGSAS